MEDALRVHGEAMLIEWQVIKRSICLKLYAQIAIISWPDKLKQEEWLKTTIRQND